MTHKQCIQWLLETARASIVLASDPDKACVHFLNQLFRHVTTTKGPFSTMNKMVEQNRISDGVILQGQKHKFRSADVITPLRTPAQASATSPAQSSATELVEVAFEVGADGSVLMTTAASPLADAILRPQRDARLEGMRAQNLRAREATLAQRKSEATLRLEKQRQLVVQREANILARQERYREIARSLAADSDEEDGRG